MKYSDWLNGIYFFAGFIFAYLLLIIINEYGYLDCGPYFHNRLMGLQ